MNKGYYGDEYGKIEPEKLFNIPLEDFINPEFTSYHSNRDKERYDKVLPIDIALGKVKTSLDYFPIENIDKIMKNFI